jgi:hypothetical protein
MKYLLFIGFVIGSCALFFSCKKDKAPPVTIPKTIDTLYPLSYLPVYPGSYWKYVDSNGDSTIDITNPTYELDYYITGWEASDTFYVPKYNGINIWGYKEHLDLGPSYAIPMRIVLDETLTIGADWMYVGWGGSYRYRKITAIDTSITIFGNTYYPTIIVEEYSPQGLPSWISRRYYTKNIGLIKEETELPANVKLIYDYHINN